MHKLDEMFVNSINEAIQSIDLMTDLNQKPMAYAAVAQAIATYMQVGVAISHVQPAETEPTCDISEPKNEEVEEVKAEVIEETLVEEEEIIDEEWQLSYGEDGTPYLNPEDFEYPERMLAYEEAMEALAETTEEVPSEETEEVLEAEAPVAEAEDSLAAYKVSFDYENNPEQLNTLVHNFTEGHVSDVEQLDAEITEAFVLFLQESLANSYDALSQWVEYFGEEGINQIISDAYGVDDATMDEYISDSNIFWFIEHLNYVNSTYALEEFKEAYDAATLNGFVKQYFEDSSATIDSLTEEDVVGFVNYVYELQQSA